MIAYSIWNEEPVNTWCKIIQLEYVIRCISKNQFTTWQWYKKPYSTRWHWNDEWVIKRYDGDGFAK